MMTMDSVHRLRGLWGARLPVVLPDFLTGYFLSHTHTHAHTPGIVNSPPIFLHITLEFDGSTRWNSLSSSIHPVMHATRGMEGPELRQTALPLLSQTNSDCEAKENRVKRATLPCVPQSQSPPSSSSTSSSLLLSPILAIQLAASTDLSTQPYFSPRFFQNHSKVPLALCLFSFLSLRH